MKFLEKKIQPILTIFNMDNDFEKVLSSIRSCENIYHVNSCEKLLELFYQKYINKEETNDNDLSLTYDFLKSQLKIKSDKFSMND
jgi:hypothetical protein